MKPLERIRRIYQLKIPTFLVFLDPAIPAHEEHMPTRRCAKPRSPHSRGIVSGNMQRTELDEVPKPNSKLHEWRAALRAPLETE
jgi:hypothetical protein